MNRGPSAGYRSTDHCATAREAWGADAPDWIIALASKANEIGLKRVGDLIGYSGSSISETISKKFRGRFDKVETAVRGALMGLTVECPGLGRAIGVDRCSAQQKRPFSSSSPMAARLSRACRTCPNREVKS